MSGISGGGGAVSFAAGTITASAPNPDISQTWNNAAVTFTALNLVVTDTASQAGSLLASFKVGANNRMSLAKNGDLTFVGRGIVGGGSLTTAAAWLDISGSWVASGIVMDGIKVNITDSASDPASRLLLLQIAGSDKLSVSKAGNVTAAGAFIGTQAILATGTLTASAPLVDGSQTWNSVGVTFTGLKVNVTDTTSAAASLLFDFQIGTSSRAALRKDGVLTIKPQTAGQAALVIDAPTTSQPEHIGFYAAGVRHWQFGGSGGTVPSDDFVLFRYNDSGTFQGQSLNIDRTNGRVTFTETTFGYGGTGIGGTVTQATSRTTGVTLNKVSGQITLVSAANSTTGTTFTVTNSTVDTNCAVVAWQVSGTDKQQVSVTRVASGAFDITFRTFAGTTTEQPVFGFMVMRAPNA